MQWWDRNDRTNAWIVKLQGSWFFHAKLEVCKGKNKAVQARWKLTCLKKDERNKGFKQGSSKKCPRNY